MSRFILTAAGLWLGLAPTVPAQVQQSTRSTPARVCALHDVVGVAAGGIGGLAVKSDGTVWEWYGPSAPARVSELTGVVAVAAGVGHYMALKSDGTVWEWPGPWIGPVPAPPGFDRRPYQISEINEVVAIAAGETRSLAVKRDGTVWEWIGQPAADVVGAVPGKPSHVTGLDGVVAVSVAYEAWMHSLFDSRTVALKGDGTVWVWHAGEQARGATQITSLDRIVAISASTAGDVALKDDGTVWEWDDGLAPVQVIGLDGIVAVANGTAGGGYAPARSGGYGLAMKGDGTVWVWESPARMSSPPAQVQGLMDVVKIAAAGVYVYTSGKAAVNMAIKSDRTVWTWGETWNAPLSDTTACVESKPAPSAPVMRIETESVSEPASDGYVTITGRAYGEVDPAHPQNAIVQDIGLASRNERGKVEYSMDFTILKPPAGGNGLLFYEAVNRGWPLMRTIPLTGIEALARKRGYTIVWSGWQGDVKKSNPLRHTIALPTATEDGRTITGWVWTSVEVTRPSASAPFAEPNNVFTMYDAVDRDDVDSELTRQRGPDDPPQKVPREDWAFARCTEGNPFPGVPDMEYLCVHERLEAPYVYTVRYRAKDPRVMGLGLAAIRDFVSFLKYDSHDRSGAPNPVYGMVKGAVMHGISQSGAIIRTFLHLGFNSDEQGRTVFEGMNPVVAGTRTALNVRFALPSPAQASRLGHLRPGWQSPFTWMPQVDPVAGRTAGVLQRSSETGTAPKIIHVVSSAEYWNSRASLTGTAALGDFDSRIPSNVRMYLISGTQHSPAPFPPGRSICQQLANPNDSSPYLRALIVALEEWVLENRQPPPSQIPALVDGSLVAPDASSIGWPEIPGVKYTGRVNSLPLVDFGPDFNANDMSGVLADRPAIVASKSYCVLVPKVDADGNEIAGIRPTTVQAPIATYTGWNLQREGFAEDELCSNTGSYIPFVTSRAERDAARDPRLSLEERYGNHAGYVDAVRKAADQLVSRRFLLPDDAQTLIADAEKSAVLGGTVTPSTALVSSLGQPIRTRLSREKALTADAGGLLSVNRKLCPENGDCRTWRGVPDSELLPVRVPACPGRRTGECTTTADQLGARRTQD